MSIVVESAILSWSAGLGALLYAAILWASELMPMRSLDPSRNGGRIARKGRSLSDAGFCRPDPLTDVTVYVSHCAAFVLLTYSVYVAVCETVENCGIPALQAAGAHADAALRASAMTGGLFLGAYLLYFIEHSRNLRVVWDQWLPRGSMVAFVMFVHAALEGCMLAVLRPATVGDTCFALFVSSSSGPTDGPAYCDIFWSVVLHNVPEGFVVAVGSFGKDGPRDTSTATPTTPIVLERMSIGESRRSFRIQKVFRAVGLAVVSHVGQSLALLTVASLSKGPDVSGSAASEHLSVASLFLTCASLGTMAATIWFEVIPDVLNAPPAARRGASKFLGRKTA